MVTTISAGINLTVVPNGGSSTTATCIPGWSGVPSCLIKIIALEFVDMQELLPKIWRLQPEEESCCRSWCPRRSAAGHQFSLWAECYAIFVVVLSVHYPHNTPLFMAYLKTIT